MSMKQNKFNKYFLLNGKKIILIIGAFFVAVILHNLIYGLFQSYFDSTGGDEPVFFIIAVIIIPLYFLICFIYTTTKMIRDKSIFEKIFIIRVLSSVILSMIISYLLVEFTFINPMGFYMLAVIFTFIVYYLIKLTIK